MEEYHRWLEVVAGWLALIDDCYVGELRESLTFPREIKQAELKGFVAARSARLFYYLQQSLQRFDRGMELIRSTSMRQGQAACGYECLRQTVGEGSSNSCVGMSAGEGSNSLVGMSA